MGIPSEAAFSSGAFSQIRKPSSKSHATQSHSACSTSNYAPSSLAQSFENLSLAVGNEKYDPYMDLHHENSILHHLLPSEQEFGLSDLISQKKHKKNQHPPISSSNPSCTTTTNSNNIQNRNSQQQQHQLH